ncbi:MAG: CoA pyrophosphatase [Immundisolibacteraceae bacterium]|nr:CoA pyrophosphatase [Immundisolibacteraceae bacterium]
MSSPNSSDLPENILRLKKRLQLPLPGETVRATMFPTPESGDEISRPALREDHRKAAVLFLLYPGQNLDNNAPDLHLVFIQRPDYDGTHSGQISLPGGRHEDDETLEQTALRESFEEVGVDPDLVTVLGELEPMNVFASNHNVYPFIGYSPVRPDFIPCRQEVAAIIEAPINVLLQPGSRLTERRELKRWGPTQVPFYSVNGHKIWGATAIMLAEFLQLLTECLDDE